MNKKLLAVAVGAAIAGVPMFANAAATVYGAVHLSIDSVRGGSRGEAATTPISDNQSQSISSNSSFVGIKAEDDIGGGMKGIVGAEWQMGFDTADTNMTNRNVFAGLQGGFGTIRLGHFDDAVKQVGRKVDMFHNEQIGESRSITAANGFDRRVANGIRYDSPKLGPVSLNAHYGFAASADQNGGSDYTTWILGAEVNAGGLFFGLAHREQEADDNFISGPAKESQRATRAAASYQFGFGLKLAALYQWYRNPGNYDSNAGNNKTYGGGVSMKVGKGVIKAQYYKRDVTYDFNTRGANLAAAGYDHNFSKNTMVYLVYGHVHNQYVSNSTIIGSGHDNPTDDLNEPSPGSGGHTNAISAGIKVKF